MVEKEKTEYKIVEVPTQTAEVIQTPTGEVVNINQAVVDILNKLDVILTKF